MKRILRFSSILLITLLVFLLSCKRGSDSQTLFQDVPSEETGIAFSNLVVQSGENHVLNYPYFFNGGGVAVGDINNDGFMDVYFSGNQVSNKLYLNKGNFEFEDITDRAGVGVKNGWKTGVTMADVNMDGYLDIYVCRSAISDSVMRENLLFINNGDLTFTEKAKQFGIADDSYSTHASFFDYDRDGDLDLFVLNHSLPKYGGFSRLLKDLKTQKATNFGSKLFRNDNGMYNDVSEQAGLINNVLSFGLGIAVSDVNQDGWLDMYVSNDFNEEDYLYINQKDGTFKNTIKEATGHVSLFSMGSDVADINNDALPDIFTLDMLPKTNERIKLSSGDDNFDKYQLLIDAGFHHQSMRNMLQLNNGNGTFSEIGQLAGLSNTDWSWAALFVDFDGDGWKDVFVSNGYEKDYTNMQFLKFTVDEQLKARQTGTSPDVQLILNNMPAIEVGNDVFRNNGDLTFSNQSNAWGLTRKFKSNGAAIADLDNDGDPDLLINVMNGPAAIYKNTGVEKFRSTFLTVDLSKNSRPIVGTKLFIYQENNAQFYEYASDRGFQSAQYGRLYVGTGGKAIIDSLKIVWPDGKTKTYERVPAKDTFIPAYKDAVVEPVNPLDSVPLLKEISALQWSHALPVINDFKRQFLLPKLYSFSGPKLATGDVNGDGLEDVYFCTPQGGERFLYIQKNDGSFTKKGTAGFQGSKNYHDEDAVFFDADHDGDLDLHAVSGGYFLTPRDPFFQDRLYFNDGKGNFNEQREGLPNEHYAGAKSLPVDIDNDGDLDLFIGNNIQPGRYPESEHSQMLLNDGKGKFADATDQIAQAFKSLGLVRDAVAGDIDGDKRSELIVTGEWMPIMIFGFESGKLVDKTSKWFNTSNTGWWNCLTLEDFDNDGDLDLMAGNYGKNNQFNVSAERPLSLVYKDFDGDNQLDPFLCYYIDGKSYPYASRDEALGQVSFLKRKFTDYTQYANATLETIFTSDQLKDAKRLDAKILTTSYFENMNGRFETRKLPVQVQFSPVHAIESADVDHDGDWDVVMGGNESNVRVRIGRSDANRGLVLINDGKGNFSYLPPQLSGLDITGDVRSIKAVGNKLFFGVMGSNVKTFEFQKGQVPSL